MLWLKAELSVSGGLERHDEEELGQLCPNSRIYRANLVRVFGTVTVS